MNLDLASETINKQKEDDTWALLMNLDCQQIELQVTLSRYLQYLFRDDLSYSFKLKVIKLYDDNNWLHDKKFLPLYIYG